MGQSDRTPVQLGSIDAATLTRQNLTRLSLGSIRSRLYRLNSCSLTVNSNSIMVAPARILLPQASRPLAQSHARDPGPGPMYGKE